MLARLPDASVHMCVTSPPYFGLRQYLPSGHADFDKQIGLEPTPDAFVAEMVAVFREVRRVLRDDGTLWLNLGDSYAGSWGSQGRQGNTGQMAGRSVADARERSKLQAARISAGAYPSKISGTGSIPEDSGLKPKDLIGIPWRVAFALQADGWFLRSEIIWAKPNPMPESISDRPTGSHEHVFLLAKSGNATFWTHRDGAGARRQPEPDYRWIHKETGEERAEDPGGWPLWRRVNLWRGRDYFYDAEAIAEPSSPGSHARMSQDVEKQIGSFRANGGAKSNGPMKAVTKKMAGAGAGIKYNESYDAAVAIRLPTRNARNVWTIATKSFNEAHFATFPPELAERCIKAGTSEKGCCAQCGAPWARSTERTAMVIARSDRTHDKGRTRTSGTMLQSATSMTTGWHPTCGCDAATVPCTVLDPFAGAFTSMLVADRLQRDGIGIELSESYCEMARRRLLNDAPLLTEIAKAPQRPRLFS